MKPFTKQEIKEIIRSYKSAKPVHQIEQKRNRLQSETDNNRKEMEEANRSNHPPS